MKDAPHPYMHIMKAGLAISWGKIKLELPSQIYPVLLWGDYKPMTLIVKTNIQYILNKISKLYV